MSWHFRVSDVLALINYAMNFLLLFCPLFVIAANADRPALVGEVAYSEPVMFDYNRDGRPKRIQLWASFDIKPAV